MGSLASAAGWETLSGASVLNGAILVLN